MDGSLWITLSDKQATSVAETENAKNRIFSLINSSYFRFYVLVALLLLRLVLQQLRFVP